jgi:hypothetical protein
MTTEIRCRPLDIADLESELGFIRDYFKKAGGISLDVMYGWDCNLEQDELYKTHLTPVDQLLEFISESRKKGVFVLGESDMHIELPDGNIRIDLCHESDIHFHGPKDEAEKLQSRWEAKGFRPYVVEHRRPPSAT